MERESSSDAAHHMVFVYGTLKRGQPNHCRIENCQCGKANFIAKGYTELPYPLVLATRWKVPFLLFVPGKGRNLEGEVYDVDSTMLSYLDKFEAHPDFYQRRKINIVIGDDTRNNTNGKKIIQCWTYFLKDVHPRLLNLTTISNFDHKKLGQIAPKDENFKGLPSIIEALQQEH